MVKVEIQSARKNNRYSSNIKHGKLLGTAGVLEI